ncbi:hypothetical protein [Desulfitobacterium hafniense]|uniref:Uncharacterized protein n=1 Tax=Desulfitobacterium hafniense TaxID=49338 RepID=A0A0W1JJN8_DESHA|nr:hypothetical protein [Desulfitobacterium hafniense]KTE91835.1 hypothetical protein AT727_20375 [Desulfitobacterium hafniense]
MGGSNYDGGGGSPTINLGCGGIFEFLLITNDNQETIWQECKAGQEVYLELVEDELPRLEARRLSDDLILGLVPPSKIMLISCIKDGWEYQGRIEKISGSEYDPKIYIKVRGIR